MKKFLPVFSIFLLSVCACEHADVDTEEVKLKGECAVERPLEDLEWLQQEIQSLEQSSLTEYFYVQQAELMHATVFIFGNCCPYCNSIMPVYNCQGEMICTLGNCGGVEDLFKNKKLIWHTQDFACNL